MSIEANCPVCDGHGEIYETAPRYHNCDVIGSRCIRCSGKGSVEVEVECAVCDNGVIREGGIGFCSQKCLDAEYREARSREMKRIIHELEITAGGLRYNERDYTKEAEEYPNSCMERTEYQIEERAIARTAATMCRLHAESLEKILASLKGANHESEAA